MALFWAWPTATWNLAKGHYHHAKLFTCRTASLDWWERRAVRPCLGDKHVNTYRFVEPLLKSTIGRLTTLQPCWSAIFLLTFYCHQVVYCLFTVHYEFLGAHLWEALLLCKCFIAIVHGTEKPLVWMWLLDSMQFNSSVVIVLDHWILLCVI